MFKAYKPTNTTRYPNNTQKTHISIHRIKIKNTIKQPISESIKTHKKTLNTNTQNTTHTNINQTTHTTHMQTHIKHTKTSRPISNHSYITKKQPHPQHIHTNTIQNQNNTHTHTQPHTQTKKHIHTPTSPTQEKMNRTK